jgi:DNA-nicking Smr family endonuclease
MGWLKFLYRLFIRAEPSAPEPEDDDASLPDFFEITDELDLHGYYPEQIRRMVPDFIENAVALDLDEVKIIHGKGRGKMKAAVLRMLSDHPLVASFRDAPSYSSGWGATIIRLAKPRNPR